MTLNGVMAVTLHYFTEFGKPALQKTMYFGICARVYCIFSACIMSSQRTFTFAISFPDEFLVNMLFWRLKLWLFRNHKFRVSLKVTTTKKKVVNFLGEKVHSRDQRTSWLTYEKRLCLTLVPPNGESGSGRSRYFLLGAHFFPQNVEELI